MYSCSFSTVLFEKFSYDFKAMFLVSEEFLYKDNLYPLLYDFMESRVPYNTYYWLKDSDISDFKMHQYVISQLEDIAEKEDLDDERVLPYSQPVFNVSTQSYDTAEALMRLELPETGLIYPDQFIPLAEQYNYIHSLSLIILNKTCKMIKKYLQKARMTRTLSLLRAVLKS